jgi:hypothetical protein
MKSLGPVGTCLFLEASRSSGPMDTSSTMWWSYLYMATHSNKILSNIGNEGCAQLHMYSG